MDKWYDIFRIIPEVNQFMSWQDRQAEDSAVKQGVNDYAYAAQNINETYGQDIANEALKSVSQRPMSADPLMKLTEGLTKLQESARKKSALSKGTGEFFQGLKAGANPVDIMSSMSPDARDAVLEQGSHLSNFVSMQRGLVGDQAEGMAADRELTNTAILAGIGSDLRKPNMSGPRAGQFDTEQEVLSDFAQAAQDYPVKDPMKMMKDFQGFMKDSYSSTPSFRTVPGKKGAVEAFNLNNYGMGEKAKVVDTGFAPRISINVPKDNSAPDKGLMGWERHVKDQFGKDLRTLLANKPGAIIFNADGSPAVNFATLTPEQVQQVNGLQNKYNSIQVNGEEAYTADPNFFKKGYASAYRSASGAKPKEQVAEPIYIVNKTTKQRMMSTDGGKSWGPAR